PNDHHETRWYIEPNPVEEAPEPLHLNEFELHFSLLRRAATSFGLMLSSSATSRTPGAITSIRRSKRCLESSGANSGLAMIGRRGRRVFTTSSLVTTPVPVIFLVRSRSSSIHRTSRRSSSEARASVTNTE